jgi:hypothetical protein
MKVKLIPPDEMFLGLTIASTGLLIELGVLVLLMD